MKHDGFGRIGRRDMLRFAGTAAALTALAAAPRRGWAQATATPGTPNVATMKIGMVGAGREGGALGTLWAKAGHAVMFSSRHPEELKSLLDGAGPTARAGTVHEAVAFGDVVVVVVPYTALKQIGQDYAAALAAKPLVMDVSNPIARRDGDEIVKWVDEQGGAGLASAKLLPGAKLVRAFNAIGYSKLAPDAHRSGEPIGVPIAGDDQNAIAIASALAKEIGFEPVLIGGLAKGKYLVPGTALGGEHSPAELQKLAADLH